MRKTFSCACGKMAVWAYAPAGSEDYCCDECVPRGCSCNVRLKSGKIEVYNELTEQVINRDDDYETMKDEKGRELPCCEWDYKPAGVIDYKASGAFSCYSYKDDFSGLFGFFGRLGKTNYSMRFLTFDRWNDWHIRNDGDFVFISIGPFMIASFYKD